MCVKQEVRLKQNLKLSELLELEEMFNNMFEESPISIWKLMFYIIIIIFYFLNIVSLNYNSKFSN